MISDLLFETRLEKSRLNTKLKEETKLKNYKKPIEVQMNLTQELRDCKVKEKAIRDEIRKKLTYLKFM